MAWDNSHRRAGLPADWPTRRQRVLSRDGYRCRIKLAGVCTGIATDVDHIQRGDNHADENLQAACHPCHAKKTSAESISRRRQLRAARFRPQDRHPGARQEDSRC